MESLGHAKREGVKIVKCYLGVDDGWNSETRFYLMLDEPYKSLWENGGEAFREGFLEGYIKDSIYWGREDE